MVETLDKRLTRRQFLKRSAAAGTAALSFSLGGCSTKINLTPVSSHKVQPPATGCFYGIGSPGILLLEHYERVLGKRPAVATVHFRLWQWDSYRRYAKEYASQGAIPALQFATSTPSNTVKGVHDEHIKRMAEDLFKLGNDYGGFFFTPMYEMNLRKSHYGEWRGQPSGFKDAWRYIWHIFEEQGTNKYATWTPSYQMLGKLTGYWPGDKYVDWVGFSVYNQEVKTHMRPYRHLKTIVDRAYSHFSYKGKPYILLEMGTTKGWRQLEWLRKGYAYIKKRPNFKSASYWDNYNGRLNDDHTLSPEAQKTLKDILKDPYFIGATDRPL